MDKNITEIFKGIESDLDKKVDGLSIWELPFQTVMSWLLFAIETIDLNGRKDTAADYTSRLSYIYDLVRKKAAKAEIVSTTQAMTGYDLEKYKDDLNFLMAYAHYSMLMPQFHRGTFTVSQQGDKEFKIEFTDKEYENAEILDRLYSYLSVQMAISFRGEEEVKAHLLEKARQRDTTINGHDAYLLTEMTRFYKNTNLSIQVLPDALLVQVLGFSYDQYQSFCAAVKAYCEYFSILGRSYNSLITDRTHPDANVLASEHMEWAVCCINKNAIGLIQGLSELDSPTFKRIFEYYLTKYTDTTTTDKFEEKAFCKEGYFPPFIWMDDTILFSSVGTRYMLPFNSILYSVNKKSEKLFANSISPQLEPSLLKQIEYVFSFLKSVRVKTNVNYATGEIDIIILSESENTAISMQVKATIAPDSARTVQRVEDRANEGLDQIRRFRDLSQAEKDAIINREFTTQLSNISFIDLLMVRSCAGSAEVWKCNPEIPLVNYSLLATIIADKVAKGDHSIANLQELTYEAQADIVKRSAATIKTETLKIGDYTIEFPNVESDMGFIVSMHTKSLKNFPEVEKVPH